MITRYRFPNFLHKYVFLVVVIIFSSTYSHAQESCDNIFPKDLEVLSLTDLNEQWMKIVSQRLRVAVLQKNHEGMIINQQILAEAIGLKKTQVSRFFNGQYSLSLPNAKSIAEFLDLDITHLLAIDFLKGFDLQEDDFVDGRGLNALKDTFRIFIWNVPHVDQPSISPESFCLENCSTEDLVDELVRRGYTVHLERGPQ